MARLVCATRVRRCRQAPARGRCAAGVPSSSESWLSAAIVELHVPHVRRSSEWAGGGARARAVPGRTATRGTMRIYEQGGALGNRVGQRFKLLRVRRHLVHVVRAVLGDRDWKSLPRGQEDLELLRSRE